MTLIHGIYFFSMIVTSILMASIAWFAWHNRDKTRGTLTYTMISALSSFMCLCEFLILLSHSEETARLWFNLRFVTFAFAPVLWFIFSLYYTGREYLIQGRKKLLLFIVPSITQIAVLTSPYHKFWVKHDVEFYRSGLFMFANTTVREFGPWMRIHFIYTYIFMTSGLLILLFYSFRMKTTQKKQAFTIGTGTLLMLIGSLYPAFNLIPGMSTNIMQISIALGTLIISWGIYRYRFLTESPVIDKSQPIPVPLMFLFTALTIIIITVGYNNYSRYREAQRSIIENELSSIADLKVNEILNWRKERISDGNTLCGNLAFNELAVNLISSRGDGDSRRKLLSWLTRILTAYEYDFIILADSKGENIISVPHSPSPDETDWNRHINFSGVQNGAYLTDLHRVSPDSGIHMSVIVPVRKNCESGVITGFVIMIIDPEKYLYPFIERWPVQSNSAETLIIRREGDDVLFLNELRFNKIKPLNYIIPMSEGNIPAVKAALGYEGIFEGVDYRGVNVVASIRKIPGSSWHLISKVDSSEVFGPVRSRFTIMVILIIAFVSTTGMVFVYFWRRQNENFFRKEYQTLLKLRESEKMLREAQDMAHLGYWDWNIKTGRVEWSDEVYKIFCLDRESFTPQIDSILALSPWPDDHKRDIELVNRAVADHSQGSYEQRFLRPDGSTGYYYSTFQGLYDHNGELVSIKGTVLDITERKLSEIALRESEQRLRNALENIPDVITIYDTDLRIRYINMATREITGFSTAHFIGKSDREIWPVEIYSRWLPLLEESLSAGVAASVETTFAISENNLRTLFIKCIPLLNDDGTVREIIGITHDLTERRNYEALLREKETIFNSLLEFSPIYIFFKDHYIRPVYLSRNYEKMIGMPLENILGKTMDELFPSELSKSMIADDRRILENNELVEVDEELNGRYYFTVKFPVHIEGKPPMLAGFTIDITERKIAEKALAEREERYRKLHETMFDAFVEVDMNGKVIDSNNSFQQMIGYTADELYMLNFRDLTPERWHNYEDEIIEKQILKNGYSEIYEKEYIHKNGIIFPVELRASLLYGSDGIPSAIWGMVRDITARKQMELSLRKINRIYLFLSELNKTIVRVHNRQQLFDSACRIAIEFGGFLMSWIGVPDNSTMRVNPVSSAGHSSDYLENIIITLDDSEHAKGPTATAIKTGNHVVVNDIERDYRMRPWREKALRFGYRASAAFPIIIAGEVVAAFNLYSNEKGFFDDDELKLLDDLAADLAFALEYIEHDELRKEAESSLQLQSAALENAANAVIITDRYGIIQYVNPSFEELSGFSFVEAIGKTPGSLIKSGRHDEIFYKGMWEAISSGNVWFGEIIDRRKNGDLYTAEITIAPVKDISGEICNFVAIKQDITEKKLATDLLKVRLELINYASEHTLNELLVKILDEFEKFTSSRVGFFHFVDDDQKTLTLQAWSTATVKNFCAALGSGLHYNISDAGVWVECVFTGEPVIHNDYNSLTHKKGLPQGHAPLIRELVIPVKRDGRIKAILGIGNKPVDYNRSDVSIATYFAEIAWDIVEKKRISDNLRLLNMELEERIMERTAELAKANRELESFTYSVSHDLRAPLRHITGFLEMFRRESVTAYSGKAEHYINVIDESAKKMTQLIDDLLSFSRMGRASLQRQPVDMNMLLTDVIHEFTEDIENGKITVLKHELPAITGDRAMLRIVLVNLISNAIKFTSRTVNPEIAIGCSSKDNSLSFYVRDNGAGFDMQYADKLFGVFQRMHSDREFPGTGIGLAMVKNIIERHGGSVRAESEPERGTSIFFTIPLNDTAEKTGGYL